MIDTFPAGANHFGFFAIEDPNSGDVGDKVYIRAACLNRPSASNDAWGNKVEYAGHLEGTSGSPADAVDRFEGRVWLGRFRGPEGALARIEQVIVDYDYWNQAEFTTPAFTVKADYVHGGSTKGTVTVGSIGAQSPTSANYLPERSRTVFNPAATPLSSYVDVYICLLYTSPSPRD